MSERFSPSLWWSTDFRLSIPTTKVRWRGADGVYDQLLRNLPPRGDLYSQDFQGRQAGGFACRAAHEIRICDQPQDGEGARARGAALAARARASPDRMKSRLGRRNRNGGVQ